MKILISGGGIGGLTAALCFLHHGHQVQVLERAARLRSLGAGIQLPPNAMKVFAALGLAKTLDALAHRPTAIEARIGQSGRPLLHIPLREAATARWGAPYLHIHRADYIAVLAKALRAQSPNAVRLGAAITRYKQLPGRVEVQLANNKIMSGDVLIGADGIHSRIAQQIQDAEEPIFTGNVAWRALVPMAKLGDDAPPPSACVWLGAGRHCVTYRLRRGTLANFVGVVERDDWQIDKWRTGGTPAQALADFENWHPTITRILREAKTLHRWALFDRPPLEKWVDDRVALLGDAAHPMLPFMAQGAAMAVEDAWVVAQKLSANMPIKTALQAYQTTRFGRACTAQAGARRTAKIFHQPGFYAPLWLLGKIAPAAIIKRQTAFYAHDVTQN